MIKLKNYDKTLWENNRTVVDAEKLNNIEDQLSILTKETINQSKRIQVTEDAIPMKANVKHTHEDLATSENLNLLTEEIEELKLEIKKEFNKFFDNAEIDDGYLKLYSHGVLIKSLKLPEVSPRLNAICGEFLSGELNSGDGIKSKKEINGTVWIDHETPVNAENLNKIENNLIKLSSKIAELEEREVAASGVHIGNTPPVSTDVIWVDPSDESSAPLFESEVLENISNQFKEHADAINYLLSITMGYIDDGDFSDLDDDTEDIDGGVF